MASDPTIDNTTNEPIECESQVSDNYLSFNNFFSILIFIDNIK